MDLPFASVAGAVGWLDAHVDYERVAPTRRALPTLETVREALRLLGDPQEAFPVIHITGTNGKGSTTTMITALLSEAGLSVGTYTSPNLHRVNERIARNEVPISDGELVDVLSHLALIEPQLSEPLTRFELLTLAALVHFANEAVEVAVVEVGLGGTWDSTNVVDGEVAVITTIGLDHTAVLGSTPEEIATDKSGIIKPGSTAILGQADPSIVEIVQRRCDEVGTAALWVEGSDFSCVQNRLAFGGRLVDLIVPGGSFHDLLVPLHGEHQGRNAAVALAAVSAFLGRAPSDEVVEAGLARVTIPGRLEILGHLPLVVVDGAHNAQGSAALGMALSEGFSVAGDKVLVIGMLEGRDPLDLLAPLAEAGVTKVVCVAPETPRAMAPQAIADAARSIGLEAMTADSIRSGCIEGLKLAGDEGMVLATGSLYVVGDARLTLLSELDLLDR